MSLDADKRLVLAMLLSSHDAAIHVTPAVLALVAGPTVASIYRIVTVENAMTGVVTIQAQADRSREPNAFAGLITEPKP